MPSDLKILINSLVSPKSDSGIVRCRQILIPGNSGTIVEMVGDDHRLVIRKTACKDEYIPRLHAQRIKQEKYAQRSYDGITIPKVLAYGENWFEMEYLRMMDSIRFFERAMPDCIVSNVSAILGFISNSCDYSKEAFLDRSIIFNKLKAIELKIDKEIWKAVYSSVALIVLDMLESEVKLLIGECHGDLTWSNVLFSIEKKQVGFLDFLDSFIESPAIDIAKLRQDTRFYWTANRYSHGHDKAKIMLVNQSLDNVIYNEFKDIIETKGFRIVEIMNYLRIAPYVRDSQGHKDLGLTLKQLIY